jgi:hypothetical protein
MTREMGKPVRESRLEAGRAAAIFRFISGEGWRALGQVYEQSPSGAAVYTRRRPHGVDRTGGGVHRSGLHRSDAPEIRADKFSLDADPRSTAPEAVYSAGFGLLGRWGWSSVPLSGTCRREHDVVPGPRSSDPARGINQVEARAPPEDRPEALLMRPHDVSIDQGRSFESSRPTTHSAPTFELDGVLRYR